MITANELRVGNWVKSKALNIPRLNIQGNGFMQITAFGIHMLDAGLNLEPIALTSSVSGLCVRRMNERPSVGRVAVTQNQCKP